MLREHRGWVGGHNIAQRLTETEKTAGHYCRCR
jgi:hypothetical protein